ncbi:MAG: hypothetical protein ACFFE7_10330 [Candidatus Thorarchaeota archaeon]
MNRRVAAVVLALLIVGAGTAIFLLPRSSDTFKFDRELPEGEYDHITIQLRYIRDCTLNVSFVDDPDLMYTISIQLYEPSTASAAFDIEIIDYVQSFWTQIDGKVPMKSIQLVLGTGLPYELGVTGSNVNATIIYANNAIGSESSLVYSPSDSILNLTLTQDMVFSQTGMEVSVGSIEEPDTVYLYTDLPAGVNGRAIFQGPLTIHSITGWEYRSEILDAVLYSTDPLDTEPLLAIGIRVVDRIHAWLID